MDAKEGAYAMIQGTRPYSLARGLNDSPAGLAAWIVEKFHALERLRRRHRDAVHQGRTADEHHDLLGDRDDRLVVLPYYDFTNSGPLTWMVEAFKQWTGSSDVPAAFAMFPKDISQPPREWAERFFNVQRWTRDAARRALRRDGGTRAAGRGYPRLLSSSAIGRRP